MRKEGGGEREKQRREYLFKFSKQSSKNLIVVGSLSLMDGWPACAAFMDP